MRYRMASMQAGMFRDEWLDCTYIMYHVLWFHLLISLVCIYTRYPQLLLKVLYSASYPLYGAGWQGRLNRSLQSCVCRCIAVQLCRVCWGNLLHSIIVCPASAVDVHTENQKYLFLFVLELQCFSFSHSLLLHHSTIPAPSLSAVLPISRNSPLGIRVPSIFSSFSHSFTKAPGLHS